MNLSFSSTPILILVTQILIARETSESSYSIHGLQSGEISKSSVSPSLEIVPKLPHGHKQFQFFNLDPNGKLHKQWMSLQEVQNIILAYASNRQSEWEYLKREHEPLQLKNQFNTQVDAQPSAPKEISELSKMSVEDVLASVQKVMSKELTNTLPSTTQNLNENEGTTTVYNDDVLNRTTLYSNVLKEFLENQVASLDTNNPWGFMTNTPTTQLFDDLYSTTKEIESTTSRIMSEDEITIPADNYVTAFDRDESSTRFPEESNTHFFGDNTVINEDSTFSPEETTTLSLSTNDIAYIMNTMTKDEISTSIPTTINVSEINNPQINSIMEIEKSTTNMPVDSEIVTYKPNSLQDYLHKVALLESFKKHSNSATITDILDATTELINDLNQPTKASVLNMPQEANFETASTTPELYPQTTSVWDLKNKTEDNLVSKSSSLTSATGANDITPLEIAQSPHGNVKNLTNLRTGADYDDNYEFDDTPIYLEDLTEVEYTDENTSTGQLKIEEQHPAKPLDFPSPDATHSYHNPNLSPVLTQKTEDDVNPLQFLPAYNPAIANAENPLRKTPVGNLGLEITVASLSPDIRKYIDTMNDIAFKVYKEALGIHRRQNLVMSPLNLISTLSMLLLGSRNTTADSLSTLLQMDQFVNFNPHLVLRNVTRSALNFNNYGHESAFVNNLFIEKNGTMASPLEFFARTMEYFYKASIELVAPNEIGSVARDRSNRRVREQTNGVVENFLKPNASLTVLGPLSAVSSAYFQGKWSVNLSDKDLVDMNFIRFPSAERRLIRTVGISKQMQINAGYSEELDATVAEVPLSSYSQEVSLILVMPGQQKSFVANGLAELEKSLTPQRWNSLLRSVIPHTLNFKMPIFSHRNYLNLSGILSRIGLQEFFEDSADFSGMNGAKNLFLGDVVQLSEFHSCKLDLRMFGSGGVQPMPRYSSARRGLKVPLAAGHDRTWAYTSQEDGAGRHKSEKRKLVQPSEKVKTLAFDRAFFYVLRHNPTGFILFIGRYLDPETF